MVVAAILHTGNIVITATRANNALMPDTTQAERTCYLLYFRVYEIGRT